MNLENQASNTRSAAVLEQLSACMDGELDSAELDQLLAQLPEMDGAQGNCYASLQTYLSIGETLRSSYTSHSRSVSMLDALQAKIALEPPLQALEQPQAGSVAVPVVPAAERSVQAPHASQDAANHAIFRWKMVAGLASVAAVAMVGWNSMGLLSGQPGKGGTQIVASAQPAAAATQAQGLVQMPVTVGQNASIMLRDPRLDELLAARGQIGGTANLQMPAGFLRNATFNAEKKTACPDGTRLC